MKYAVVTGASSGIGREFAKRLSKQGYGLVLVARRRERLEELAEEIKTDTIIIVADLTKETECYRVFEEISDLPIEVFINNAGFGLCGEFRKTSLEQELRMIDLNISAVHMFTKLMISKLNVEKKGYILNVASSAGLMAGGPYMATYYATKAYVTSLTLAIARELEERRSHIYIGCLCPGPVNTEFNDVAEVEFSLRGISAAKCVRYALRKMKKRKVLIVPSLKMRMAVRFSRFLPRLKLVKITGNQQKKKIGD